MVAIGEGSLANNTTANNNTAVGKSALNGNTTGADNTSSGKDSLGSNTTGSNNSAFGSGSLVSNTTASNNTAVGHQAGYNNTTASNNAFLGYRAGFSTTTGNLNTFVGNDSGYSMTTGTKNTILGRYNGNAGGLDIRTSSNNIVLSDGDGNPRMVSQGSSALELLGGPRASLSNSLFRIVNRNTGNSSETFTAADMGMGDNITCLINISIGGTTDLQSYGGCLIYWYMPRGGNSVIHQTLVTAFKGSGVSTFSVSSSGNSLVVTKDSNLTVSITVIGGGGNGDY